MASIQTINEQMLNLSSVLERLNQNLALLFRMVYEALIQIVLWILPIRPISFAVHHCLHRKEDNFFSKNLHR